MKILPNIDLVFSGSGTLAPCHIGALSRIMETHKIKRVAGTSGGALIAAAVAFGFSIEKQKAIAEEVFGSPTILDISWLPWQRAGLYKGDRIHKLLSRYFPQKIGDSTLPWGVFASDIVTKEAVYLNSVEHTHVPVADALRASISIPFWFKAVKIRGLGDHLFVDGGVEVNMGASVFDDMPSRKTIGVTFYTKKSSGTVKSWQFIKITKNVLEMLLDNINNGYKSCKKNKNIIEIHTEENPMDFSLSRADIERLFLKGYSSASSQLGED